MIPVYSIEGHFAEARSLASIERQLERGMITVERNRKGKITRAFRKMADGRSALLRTIYVGTKYSYREKLPSGHQCHELKRLDGSRSGVNYAPDYLRPIFLNVLAGCIKQAA